MRRVIKVCFDTHKKALSAASEFVNKVIFGKSLLTLKTKLILPTIKWVYLGITENYDSGPERYGKTAGKSREQRRGSRYFREQGEVGRVVWFWFHV